MTGNLNKARVRDFFQNCTPLQCVVGEALDTGLSDLVDGYPLPLVIISRYRDNIYIVVCGVHETEYPVLKCAISAFLSVLYGIKLKREPQGVEAIWDIGTVTIGGSFGLRRKGAVMDLTAKGAEWERWLDVGSTNCK